MENIIERNKKQIEATLEAYDAHGDGTPLEWSRTFIDALARDAADAKTGLRSLLSTHPQWDDDRQAVVISADIPTATAQEKRRAINDIFFYSDVDRFISCAVSEMIVDGDGDGLNDALMPLIHGAPPVWAPGKKWSRVLHSVFVRLGVGPDNVPNFDKLFAKAADLLKPSRKETLYISINPAHILTMSNPKGDDRGETLVSCHSLNNNFSYSGGCSGYCRDTVSFIVFSAAGDSFEALTTRKTLRMMCAYENGRLMTSRLYNSQGGADYCEEFNEAIRHAVQQVFADCEGVPNMWRTLHAEKHPEIVQKFDDFPGYVDFIYAHCDARVSLLSGVYDENDDAMIVGAPGLCMQCGAETTDYNAYDDGGIYCDECEPGRRCEQCNDLTDELFTVYDRYGNSSEVCEYCRDTYYTWCERDDRYYDADYCTWVESLQMYVFEDDLSDNFVYCDDCGEYVLYDDAYYIKDEDRYICEDCYEQGDYGYCSDCGEYYTLNHLTEHDGETVCIDCAEDLEETA